MIALVLVLLTAITCLRRFCSAEGESAVTRSEYLRRDSPNRFRERRNGGLRKSQPNLASVNATQSLPGGTNQPQTSLDTKPLCTDVKRYPGKSNGAFITRDPGHWRYLPDGSMTYEIDTCTIKRFTAREARQCLADHHVLMIGDSLMRYQYISLAYFVEHGHWPARFAMASADTHSDPAKDCKHFDAHGAPTCSPPGQPSVVSENDWANVFGHATDKSWRYMHQYLGGEGMGGRMECQCARSDADRSTEVMFYERAFASNVDATLSPPRREKETERGRVELSFVSNLGEVPVHWWQRSHCSRTSSCNLTSADWYALQQKANDKQWAVHAPLTEVIDTHLQQIVPNVDVVLFNTGLWGGHGTKEIKDVMNRLFKLLQRTNEKKPSASGRCYWKNLSPAWSVGVNGYPDAFAAMDNANRVASYEAGCGVFDVSHVTKQFASFQWMGDMGRQSCCGEKEMMAVYFDAVHFQPWVNEELNQILLNVLC